MAMIVKEMLEVGKRTLEGAGIFDAKVDAESLLCHMLRIDKHGLFMMWSKTMDDAQCDIFFDLIDKRASRIPLQHIIGTQDFMGLTFKVAEHVLIPRMDTEVLVQAVLDVEEQFKSKASVLDLCCGSGAIGVSLAKLSKNMKVTCSDISDYAIALTKENAKELKANITVKQGDMFEPFAGKILKTKFDIIVSNPPYIESAVIPTLEVEVAEHEPMLALDGGSDGLVFYRMIAENAKTHLNKGGMLFLEIGHNQGEALRELLEAQGFTDVEVRQDYAGLDRVVVAKA